MTVLSLININVDVDGFIKQSGHLARNNLIQMSSIWIPKAFTFHGSYIKTWRKNAWNKGTIKAVILLRLTHNPVRTQENGIARQISI